MADDDASVNDLLDRAAHGDAAARDRLLGRHRGRLRQMVAVRMDRRLAPRLDPSDVVQDTLADAARRLPNYLRDRPMPFYAWLFRLAADRLARTHRDHVVSSVRGIGREQRIDRLVRGGPDAPRGVERLADSAPTPGHRMVREERRILLAR